MRGTASVTVGDLIAARGHRLALATGETLFHEGDRSRSVYVCVDGRIRLFVTLPSGRELVIGIKEPGEFFGELAAIDERPRGASAVAVEPTVVAHLSGEQFLDGLHDEPDLAVEVFRHLAEQVRVSNARLRARSGDTALVRTGHMLLELARLKRRHGRPNGPVELDLTQADVAEWIGTTRESTARALAHFRRAGAIETGRGHILVIDAVALASLVDST